MAVKQDTIEDLDKLAKTHESGEVFNASDDCLREYLKLLCRQEAVHNEAIQHSFVNRTLLLNTLRTERLNSAN